MKPLRFKKVVGLAIGERSLLAAEVVAGDRPEVRQVAELVYPEGISTDQPEELGKLLLQLMKENSFTAQNAVVGLPARWLLVSSKEVPVTDAATRASMLRLQAEAEFSTELKDLVYDYTDNDGAGSAASVLIVATPRKYIDAVTTLCQAAKLSLAAVMPSAVALGEATSQQAADNTLVLAVTAGGAELTQQKGTLPSAIRHLRGPNPQPPFVSELRRLVSTLSGSGPDRELVLWDGSGIDAGSLGQQLGFRVRNGDLPVLGVRTTSTTTNGSGRKYASAVSLALTGVGAVSPTIDFLHSRLAVKKEHLIPPWAYPVAIVVLAVIGLSVWAYHSMQAKQNELATYNQWLDDNKVKTANAEDFVNMVGYAQAWFPDSPRYDACLRDLTTIMPADGETYVTEVQLTEMPARPLAASAKDKGPKIDAKTQARMLTGTLKGKSSDLGKITGVYQAIAKAKGFTNVSLPATVTVTGPGGRGGRESAFTISFNYLAPMPPAAGTPAATPKPAATVTPATKPATPAAGTTVKPVTPLTTPAKPAPLTPSTKPATLTPAGTPATRPAAVPASAAPVTRPAGT